MTKNKLDLPTFEQFKNSLPKTFSYHTAAKIIPIGSIINYCLFVNDSKTTQVIDDGYVKEYK